MPSLIRIRSFCAKSRPPTALTSSRSRGYTTFLISSPNRRSERRFGLDRKSTRLNSSHSLHDALPISELLRQIAPTDRTHVFTLTGVYNLPDIKSESPFGKAIRTRSEEHTSELQSLPTRRSSDLGASAPNRAHRPHSRLHAHGGIQPS